MFQRFSVGMSEGHSAHKWIYFVGMYRVAVLRKNIETTGHWNI